MIEYV